MLPILYSFRRCPYAIRARMAIKYAGVPVELREVFLADKPPTMLAASPKGTVPVLVLPDGTVIDESVDIISIHKYTKTSELRIYSQKLGRVKPIVFKGFDLKVIEKKIKYFMKHGKLK